MSNMGFSRLRVVNPYEASFREARSAVGAAPLLARAEQYGSVAEAVADCSLVVGTTAAGNRELQQPLKLLAEGAQLIRKRLRAGGRVALLFGSEKRGLANDDLSHCHWLIHIPTRKEHVSMNLGQAVAICLYEFARSAGASRGRGPGKADVKRSQGKATIKRTPVKAGALEDKLASAGQLERLTTMLIDALRTSGYLGQQHAAAKEEKVRRMVRRLGLSAKDAEVWLGMLRQMLWKMKPPQ
jgi:tRNA/rRNA methyltransferase